MSARSSRHRSASVVAAALTAAGLVAGCGILPGIGDSAAWIWPTPFPRPSDAVAVPIEVQPIPTEIVPGAAYDACPAALLAPMTPSYHADDAARPIHYTMVGTGDEIRVVWQPGFQAWLLPGLQIVAPDGKVVAAEGLVAADLGGGGTGEGDDTFGVCMPEYGPRRVGGEP